VDRVWVGNATMYADDKADKMLPKMLHEYMIGTTIQSNLQMKYR
jgi:hypothetical protein